MELNGINWLLEWNPQLFRELKGRLKPRNLWITLASSSLIQILLILFCYKQKDFGDTIPPEWQIQWQMLFGVLNSMLPLILLVGGVYMLIGDLAKEEHRGTLNFIRLSPQSSQSILTGKLLGVPARLYLAIALALPLHLWSALATGVPFIWVAGIYTLWGAGCCLFYSAAVLIALLKGSQGGVESIACFGSFLACMFGWPYISFISLSWDFYRFSDGLRDWQWFFLPIGTQPLLACGLTLSTFGTATYWIWQAVNRRFRNPNSTLLSKQQSYWLVASFQLWLLGFVLPELNSASVDSHLFAGLSFVFLLNPICFLVLIAVLSQDRQALQDWARYRKVNKVKIKSFSLLPPSVQDLIWGEKSPALVAIAVNLLIAAAIWVPWILLWPQEVWPQDFKTPQAILGLLTIVNLILIFAAIFELILLMKPHHRVLCASATLSMVFLPPPSLLMLSLTPEKNPGLWFFSVFPVVALQHASAITVFLGLLGQWSVFGLLSWQLTRQLRRAGESTSFALFAHPSLPSNGSK